MIYEIVHNVVDQGVFKNTRGFCPVAITDKTPQVAIQPLVQLARQQVQNASHYQAGQDGQLNDFYSHFPLKLGGKMCSVLTRGVAMPHEGEKGNFLVHQVKLAIMGAFHDFVMELLDTPVKVGITRTGGKDPGPFTIQAIR